jgi:UDP-N-acetyl-D-glucosamine dehydrogenase
MPKTAIVGLGYVGLPLALEFARKGLSVVGIDIDPEKIEALEKGRSYIRHIPGEDIRSLIEEGRLAVTSEFEAVEEVEAILLCVPSPLNKNREPDLSYILRTAVMIATYFRPGTLIVLESTTYPGTTDTELRDVLETGSGMTAGKDFHLAYSPEREDPGNSKSNFKEVPKLVGGFTKECGRRAVELYSHICKVVECENCRIAEAAKLLENIFRSVNIALVNELKVVYEAMGIDIWKVIEAAKTKPYGFMPFYPGPGVGGHCIPIDPFYLSWKSREYEVQSRFIELAGELNWEMPKYVVRKIGDALNARRMAMKGSKILVLGVAYKADVEDVRESPSMKLMDLLQKRGALVHYYDPYVPEIPPMRAHPQWKGLKSVSWDAESLRGFDIVVVATAHRCVDYEALGQWAECVVDTRNVMEAITNRTCSLWKA